MIHRGFSPVAAHRGYMLVHATPKNHLYTRYSVGVFNLLNWYNKKIFGVYYDQGISIYRYNVLFFPFDILWLLLL